MEVELVVCNGSNSSWWDWPRHYPDQRSVETKTLVSTSLVDSHWTFSSTDSLRLWRIQNLRQWHWSTCLNCSTEAFRWRRPAVKWKWVINDKKQRLNLVFLTVFSVGRSTFVKLEAIFSWNNTDVSFFPLPSCLLTLLTRYTDHMIVVWIILSRCVR